MFKLFKDNFEGIVGYFIIIMEQKHRPRTARNGGMVWKHKDRNTQDYRENGHKLEEWYLEKISYINKVWVKSGRNMKKADETAGRR